MTAAAALLLSAPGCRESTSSAGASEPPDSGPQKADAALHADASAPAPETDASAPTQPTHPEPAAPSGADAAVPDPTLEPLRISVDRKEITNDGAQAALIEASVALPTPEDPNAAPPLVAIDLSALGRSPAVPMRDNAREGDKVAGDSVYSFKLTVDNSALVGEFDLPVTVRLDRLLVAHASVSMSVKAPPCVPSCRDQHCGDDGCGGDCGMCPRGETCESGLCPGVTQAKMAFIAGGTFNMGADDLDPSQPVHEVTVADFWLDETEVTAGAFAACVKAGDCTARGVGGAFSYGVVNKETHPINDVSWGDAKAYCEGLGKRLPTEPEWEYAAGGGQNVFYPWGNEAPAGQLCWQRPGGDYEATCPVASFAPGAHGLYDMAGNVWEWTDTAWCPYSSETEDGYEDCGHDYRIDRGGGWNNTEPEFVRIQNRRGFIKTKRTYLLGFRCASSTPPAATGAE